MILTQLESIRSVKIDTKSARLNNYFLTEDGSIFYEYEFDIIIDVKKVFEYNLSEITIDAYDILPRGNLQPSAMMGNNINFRKSNLQMLSAVGTEVLTNGSISQNLPSKAEIKSIRNNHPPTRNITNSNLLPAGSLVHSPGVSRLGGNNIAVIDAILGIGMGFVKAARTKIASKQKVLDTYSISLDSVINTKYKETIRSMSVGKQGKTRPRKRLPRQKKTASNILNNTLSNRTKFIDEKFELVMVPANRLRNKVSNNDIATLSTVINYSNSKNRSITQQGLPNNVSYERGANSPAPVPKNPNTPGRKTVSIDDFKIKNTGRIDSINSQIGSTLFTTGEKWSALRLIFEYGISPTAVIAVPADSSLVSPMQNYQGISNIKANGY